MATTLARFAPFILDDTYVRQDEHGRYSLNDLHQAAGGAENHKPSRFTRTDSFTALVEALRPEMASDPVAVTSTGKPGTYVARELVYAYAMWISPAFHLKVIQTFDAVMTGKPVGRTGAEVMAGDVHSGIFLACAQAQQAQVAIN